MCSLVIFTIVWVAKKRARLATVASGVYRLACYLVEAIFKRMIGTTCSIDWVAVVETAISGPSLLLVAVAVAKQSGPQKSSMAIMIY